MASPYSIGGLDFSIPVGGDGGCGVARAYICQPRELDDLGYPLVTLRKGYEGIRGNRRCLEFHGCVYEPVPRMWGLREESGGEGGTYIHHDVTLNLTSRQVSQVPRNRCGSVSKDLRHPVQSVPEVPFVSFLFFSFRVVTCDSVKINGIKSSHFV